LVGALLVLEPGERWDPVRDFVFVVSDGAPGSLLINASAQPPLKALRVGTTYRLRIADIAIYRQSLRARLTRDSALVSWRAVAKDGFPLPPHQATTRPSLAQVASGETADFEFTPDQPGDLWLGVWQTARP